MNGVGSGDSSRTSVPKIIASYPPPPPDWVFVLDILFTVNEFIYSLVDPESCMVLDLLSISPALCRIMRMT